MLRTQLVDWITIGVEYSQKNAKELTAGDDTWIDPVVLHRQKVISYKKEKKESYLP